MAPPPRLNQGTVDAHKAYASPLLPPAGPTPPPPIRVPMPSPPPPLAAAAAPQTSPQLRAEAQLSAAREHARAVSERLATLQAHASALSNAWRPPLPQPVARDHLAGRHAAIRPANVPAATFTSAAPAVPAPAASAAAAAMQAPAPASASAALAAILANGHHSERTCSALPPEAISTSMNPSRGSLSAPARSTSEARVQELLRAISAPPSPPLTCAAAAAIASSTASAACVGTPRHAPVAAAPPASPLAEYLQLDPSPADPSASWSRPSFEASRRGSQAPEMATKPNHTQTPPPRPATRITLPESMALADSPFSRIEKNLQQLHERMGH